MPSEKKAEDTQVPQERQSSLLSNIACLFNNPEYSDVTIRIFDVALHAHQLVICNQSEFLKKALQQGQTLEFTHGSGMAYWRVFEYLYTGDYSDQFSSLTWIEDPDLLKDVRVYLLADVFMIAGLKTLAVAKLQKKLDACQLDSSFTTCVREVYGQTHPRVDCKIRTAVVNRAVSLAAESLQDYISIFDDVQGFIRTSDELCAFRTLLREGGCFVDDYCMALLVHAATPKH
ncbi:hypothetical protein K3495_g3030 [Podosphaera aphanis]|nr:hypothetical protein K3495_g3030 [Podosphaera aphanis]